MSCVDGQLNYPLLGTDKMILEHNKLYELPVPSDEDVDDLYNYLESDDTGGTWLEHPENTPWAINESRKRISKDLVSLNVRRTSNDVFTTWWNNYVVGRFHNLFGKRKVSLQMPPSLPLEAH